MQKKVLFVSILILLAALSRLIPHPMNFAPIGGMSLFGAAYFSNKKFAYLMPLLAMFISDLFLNNIFYADFYDSFVLFTDGVVWIYGSILLIVAMGIFIFDKVSVPKVVLSSIAASYLFFLVTNFGFWTTGMLYPLTAEGLTACYTAAIPFFKNTLLGDLLYSGIMFGSYEVAKRRFRFLELKPQMA